MSPAGEISYVKNTAGASANDEPAKIATNKNAVNEIKSLFIKKFPLP